MNELILTDLSEGVLTITLNNPEKHNCIGLNMLNRISDVLNSSALEKEVRVIILGGAGQKAFSTGGNLNEFNNLKIEEINQWIRLGGQVFNQIEKLSKPTIAAINGYSLGGGFELAMACDLRIATENSIFGLPELQLGWPPGWGGMARLKKLTGISKAKEIVYLGEPFDAFKAYELGIINKVTKELEFEETIEHYTSKLKKINPNIFRFVKSALQDDHYDTGANSMNYDILNTIYSKIITDFHADEG